MTQQIQDLIAKAETGEDWAEICRLEAEAEANGGPFYPEDKRNECTNEYVADDGQFGVGA